jgi:hypothetical protein
MMKLPIGCAERHRKIREISYELRETFVNGNRSALLNGLLELETMAAYAVLAHMMATATSDTRESLERYLMETA